jgi:predicted transcriptional regulator
MILVTVVVTDGATGAMVARIAMPVGEAEETVREVLEATAKALPKYSRQPRLLYLQVLRRLSESVKNREHGLE